MLLVHLLHTHTWQAVMIVQRLMGQHQNEEWPYMPPEIWHKILGSTDALTCLVFSEFDHMAAFLMQEHRSLKALMDIAMQIGHLKVVKALISLQPNLASFSLAAQWGHLHILEWLHKDFASPNVADSGNAMNAAASNGHLEIVKWLHKYRTEGCSTCAMDRAALKGHLHVVRWLHEHRSEGCTTCALEYAAVNGHLNVVSWLHHHKSEVRVCIPMAMGLASQNGHTQVKDFLRAAFQADNVTATAR